jgi:signal peptide peptidase SppA
VRAITETPWAILPSAFAAIREVIALRLEGIHLSAEEIEERISAGPGSRQPFQAGAVAVLPIYGVIFPRANLMTQMSGGTSLDRLGAAIDAVAADPQVGSILLDVNSPGGSVELLPETAAKIRAARARKRVVASANGTAASAAYWLASQADELVVTPSGMVGSIGVVAAHDDQSGMWEQAGIETTLISAGRYKTEGNPFEPLSDEARASIQATVDEFYEMFVADVARGRGAAKKAVREGYGEGRVVTARAALAEGMADRIESFEATIQRISRQKAQPGGTTAQLDDAGELELADVEEEVEDEASVAVAPHAGLDQEHEYALALARLRT